MRLRVQAGLTSAIVVGAMVGWLTAQNIIDVHPGNVEILGAYVSDVRVGDGATARNVILNGPAGTNKQVLWQNAGVTAMNLFSVNSAQFWDGDGAFSLRTLGGATRFQVRTDSNVLIAGGGILRPDATGTALSVGNGTNVSFGTLEARNTLGNLLNLQVSDTGALLRWTYPLRGQNSASFGVHLTSLSSTNAPTFGPPDSETDLGCCDNTVLQGQAVRIVTNNQIRTTWENSGAMVHDYAVRRTGTISPPTLSSNVNDYNPTGLADAYLLRLQTDTSDRSITGLATGSAGRELRACNVGTMGQIILPGESASSTAGFRWAVAVQVTIDPGVCKDLIYDGVSGRWRVN